MSDAALKPPVALGIDAATPPSSVAVTRGDAVLASRTGPFGRDTDAWILPAVELSLAAAGIAIAEVSCIGVTVGPGTFTGIRVGLATAMGLGRGSGVPLVGITTLEAIALAAGADAATRVLATVDARRGQVYAAVYAVGDGAVDCLRRPWLGDPGDIARQAAAFGPLVAAGTGLSAPELAALPTAPQPSEPLAAAVALLAARRPPPDAPPVPFYLRGPDARPPRRRRTTL